ncbi:hypothetical protein [Anatilimnocola aggregata]|nr:hypothetical protein [Anatilimnocola aggregata]
MVEFLTIPSLSSKVKGTEKVLEYDSKPATMMLAAAAAFRHACEMFG